MGKKKLTDEEILVDAYLEKNAQLDTLKTELATIEDSLTTLWQTSHNATEGVIMGKKLKVVVEKLAPKIKTIAGGNFTSKMKEAFVKIVGDYSQYINIDYKLDTKLIYNNRQKDGALVNAMQNIGIECVQEEKVVFKV